MTTQPISVLLVDDNPTFLRILTRFLRQHHQEGITVAGTATSGMEALSRASDLQPEIVLLDMVMPGLSGLDLIPRLRKILPDVKIIVLTLFDTNGYRHAALEAGVDAFVPKEALNTDLVPAILRIARNRQCKGKPEDHAGGGDAEE